jgi:peptide/nickel transport system ATP-binding protein
VTPARAGVPVSAVAAAGAVPVLRIEGLSVRLPAGADRALAVEDVDLQIGAGRTLCLVGESGSGKSMVANAVMGLLPRPQLEPVAGRIVFDGEDLLAKDEAALRSVRGARIGMVFQEPMTSLNPLMRIGEQIGEVLDAHRRDLGRTERRECIVAALRDVGLPEPERIVDAYPFRLSGGQRQRVMIASALVLEPALLIADEPTTALDVTTQAQILALMAALQRSKGMSVLFITHDFGVVADIADEVAVMQFGKVVEKGPAERVLRAPAHPYTRKLIDAIPHGRSRALDAARATAPLLEVRALDKTFRSGGGLFSRPREVVAARSLEFTVAEGETLGVVGESGSGKSTLGRCLTGLVPADAGILRFAGRELALAIRRRPIAERGLIQMVFQDPYASLNPRHTVGAARARGHEAGCGRPLSP